MKSNLFALTVIILIVVSGSVMTGALESKERAKELSNLRLKVDSLLLELKECKAENTDKQLKINDLEAIAADNEM
jgi:hypothetical protein